MDSPFKVNPLKNLSKPQRYAAVGGAVAIGGYFIVHHHSKTGSWNPWSKTTGTSSGNDPTAIDPVTGMAYSQDNVTDPLTGQTYLSEAEQYGSVQAAESAVSQFGTGAGTGSGSSSGGGAGSPPAAGTSYPDDEAWAQAATAGLASLGFPETDVAIALGDYLQSIPMTADQAKYVRTALAEYGKNPSGTGSINLLPDKKPGETTADVPYVIGLDLVNAQRDISDAGLKSTANGPAFTEGHGVRVITAQDPTAQAKVTKGSNVKLTYKIEGKGK